MMSQPPVSRVRVSLIENRIWVSAGVGSVGPSLFSGVRKLYEKGPGSGSSGISKLLSLSY